MALKKILNRFTVPISELDQERLRQFCSGRQDCSPIAECQPRQEVTVVGEISSLRIVPRAGSPSLEATITDGSGSLVAVWTGRRKIAGIAPGKRLVLSGRGASVAPGNRLLILNPRYELL